MERRSFLHAFLGGLGATMINRRSQAQHGAVLIQESPIAGFQFYRGDDIWPFLQVDEKLSLVRESLNEHDRDAVAVYFKREKLGFVPRGENKAIAQMLDNGARLEARITRLLTDTDPGRRVRISVTLL